MRGGAMQYSIEGGGIKTKMLMLERTVFSKRRENKVPKFTLGMLIKKISFRINASFLKLQLPPPKLLLLSQAAATHSQAVVSLSSCCYPF